jgi:hypothetical protein
MTFRDGTRYAGLAILLALSSGCGGSSDGDNSNNNPPAPPVADTTPDAFAFPAASDMASAMLVTSDPVVISGIDAVAAISISDSAEYSIDGAAFTSVAGSVENGSEVRVRITSSEAAQSAVTAVLDVGGVSGEFVVETSPAVSIIDTDPAPFKIADTASADKGAVVTSEPFVINSINAPSKISVEGGEYSVESAEFTAEDGNVLPGQRVVIRTTAPAEDGAVHVATLRIGSFTESFVVTTPPVEGAADVVPDFFVFTSQDDDAAERDTVVTSLPTSINGINAAASILIEGGEYSVDGGGTFTDQPGEVTDGNSVIVRLRTSAAGNATRVATVTIGGIPGYFVITTRAREMGTDTVPAAFNFDPVETQQPGSIVTSELVLPSGFDAPARIGVEGGEYQLDLGEFVTNDQLMQPGQTLRVRGIAPAEVGDFHTVAVTLGGVESGFVITTAPAPVDNKAPVAIVTQDALSLDLANGTAVVLDASASNDPDGDILSYVWLQKSPLFPIAQLVQDGGAEAEAIFMQAGEYLFEVTVSDGALSSAAEVSVTVTGALPNEAPIADAGDDQTVLISDGALLSAVGTTDPENDFLSYAWSQVSGPDEATITSFGVTASVVFPVAGVYEFEVEVDDSTNISSDTVVITVEAPVAVGPTAVLSFSPETPVVNNKVTLDGSRSSDDSLIIGWDFFVTDPNGDAVVVDHEFFPDLTRATFTPVIAGDYTLTLIAVDEDFNEDEVTATMTAVSGGR